MARPPRVHCVICGGHVDDVGPLSKRKRCFSCGVGRVIQNADELHEHRGESLERWRRGMARAVGAIIPGER